MLVIVTKNFEEMSKRGGQFVAECLHKKPDMVLGLATGGTPVGTYKELVRLHKQEGLSFSKVTTFNLDEYLGIKPHHPQSYHYFMEKNFFKHINVSRHRVFIPFGRTKDIESFCDWYENKIKEAGGIDLQILGIGSNGHIAFNEPGSSFGSRTRIKKLTDQTITDNKRFFKKNEQVPYYALTMGIGTIMESKRILLLASGKNKAKVIAQSIEGPITIRVPASILQMHRDVTLILDENAASELKGTYEEEKMDRWEWTD